MNAALPSRPRRAQSAGTAALRRAAEQQLARRHRSSPESCPATDERRLLHELQVHQVELEMQNAELQDGREKTEALLEKYTDLYDSAPIGYFSLTADGRIQLLNLTGASLLGLGRSCLTGQLLGPHLQAADKPLLAAFLQQVFAGNAAQSCEVMLAGPGSRSVRIEARRQTDSPECRAVMRDVTDRRLAEGKIRISEVRYRRLFEAAHDGVLLLDPITRRITDANPFMTNLLGYPREQLVGKELFEIGLLQDEAASQAMFRKLQRKHEVRYEDLPLKSRTGRHQEVEVVANLYRENSHTVIQCNIRDITQRKLTEDALRRNEALFTALIEQAPMGVFVVDSHLRMARVNPKALPVFKQIRPLLGRDFLAIFRVLWPRRVAAKLAARFRHTLRTGAPYSSSEFAERRRDTGATQFYEWQIQRMNLPGGEHGVVCFFSDITERKKTELTQRRVTVLAAANREAKREIAHRRVVETSLRQSESLQRAHLAESRALHLQLRHLTHDLLTAQEEERKKISRDLHDDVMQTLVGINVGLAGLSNLATVDPAALRRHIVRTQRLVKNSLHAVHRFARDLRPPVLDDFGLLPALQAFGKALAARKKSESGSRPQATLNPWTTSRAPRSFGWRRKPSPMSPATPAPRWPKCA